MSDKAKKPADELVKKVSVPQTASADDSGGQIPTPPPPPPPPPQPLKPKLG